MEKILLVGDDVTLLFTRAAVLASKNIEAVSCSARELNAHPGNDKFNLVVLCHSLSESARSACIVNVRQRWPSVRILQIFKYFTEQSCAECGTDGVTTAQPWVLLNDVMRLLGKPEASSKPGRVAPRPAILSHTRSSLAGLRDSYPDGS